MYTSMLSHLSEVQSKLYKSSIDEIDYVDIQRYFMFSKTFIEQYTHGRVRTLDEDKRTTLTENHKKMLGYIHPSEYPCLVSFIISIIHFIIEQWISEVTIK